MKTVLFSTLVGFPISVPAGHRGDYCHGRPAIVVTN